MPPFATTISSDVPPSTGAVIRRRMTQSSALFTLLLVSVTWRIWLQQDAYPQIPLFGWARSAPRWIDVCLLIAMIASAIGTWMPTASARRYGGLAFLISAALLVVLDQHRLQPWLYQLMILSVFALLLVDRDYTAYARLLLVSIYLFSAWSKLDHQFLHTLGQQFSKELFGWLQINVENWSPNLRLAGAALFPVGELCVGIGLLAPKTRTLTSYVAIVLHLGLLLILGPWGLQHHYGVLTWNAFFIVQIWILFLNGPKSFDDDSNTERQPTEPSANWKQWLCTGIVLLPLLEPVGLLDHWPAWQLYAPRNSRITMSVLESKLDSLPDELSELTTGNGFWRRVNLDRWSLESIGVPIYPQDRFQLGVAIAIAEKYGLGGGVQVELQSASSRWDGERKAQTLRSVDELRKSATHFRLNTSPRTTSTNADAPTIR